MMPGLPSAVQNHLLGTVDSYNAHLRSSNLFLTLALPPVNRFVTDKFRRVSSRTDRNILRLLELERGVARARGLCVGS